MPGPGPKPLPYAGRCMLSLLCFLFLFHRHHDKPKAPVRNLDADIALVGVMGELDGAKKDYPVLAPDVDKAKAIILKLGTEDFGSPEYVKDFDTLGDILTGINVSESEIDSRYIL